MQTILFDPALLLIWLAYYLKPLLAICVSIIAAAFAVLIAIKQLLDVEQN
jgi:hypothetical protein